MLRLCQLLAYLQLAEMQVLGEHCSASDSRFVFLVPGYSQGFFAQNSSHLEREV